MEFFTKIISFEVMVAIIVIIFAGFLMFIISYIRKEREARKLHNILYERIDIDLFLRELNDKLKKIKRPIDRVECMIQKSLGFYYKGEVDTAYEWIVEARANMTDKMISSLDIKHLYHVALIIIGLDLDNKEISKQIYDENSIIFDDKRFAKEQAGEIVYLKGVYESRFGDLNLAKEYLLEAREKSYSRLQRVMTSYRMGLVEEALDNIDAMKQIFEHIIDQRRSKRTQLFVYDAIESLMKKRQMQTYNLMEVDKDKDEKMQKELISKINDDIVKALEKDPEIMRTPGDKKTGAYKIEMDVDTSETEIATGEDVKAVIAPEPVNNTILPPKADINSLQVGISTPESSAIEEKNEEVIDAVPTSMAKAEENVNVNSKEDTKEVVPVPIETKALESNIEPVTLISEPGVKDIEQIEKIEKVYESVEDKIEKEEIIRKDVSSTAQDVMPASITREEPIAENVSGIEAGPEEKPAPSVEVQTEVNNISKPDDIASAPIYSEPERVIIADSKPQEDPVQEIEEALNKEQTVSTSLEREEIIAENNTIEKEVLDVNASFEELPKAPVISIESTVQHEEELSKEGVISKEPEQVQKDIYNEQPEPSIVREEETVKKLVETQIEEVNSAVYKDEVLEPLRDVSIQETYTDNSGSEEVFNLSEISEPSIKEETSAQMADITSDNYSRVIVEDEEVFMMSGEKAEEKEVPVSNTQSDDDDIGAYETINIIKDEERIENEKEAERLEDEIAKVMREMAEMEKKLRGDA